MNFFLMQQKQFLATIMADEEVDVERCIKRDQLKKGIKTLLIRLFILFLLSAAGGFIFRVSQLFQKIKGSYKGIDF